MIGAAVLRSVRGAVGRRVLQVVLLLGGLVTIGFVWAGQAQASSGPVSTEAVSTAGVASPSSAAAVSSAGVESSAESAKPNRLVERTAAKTVGTAEGEVVRPVAERVVEPVRDEAVAPVRELAGRAAGEVAGAPEQLPSLPALPGLPVPPGASAQHPPGGTAPHDGRGAVGQVGGGTGAHDGRGAVSVSSYGPGFVGGLSASGSGEQTRHAVSAVRGPHLPVRQAPGSDPVGVLGGGSAVDNGSPRHGDAHAVAFAQYMSVRFGSGAVAWADVPAPRDRHRDIPALPG